MSSHREAPEISKDPVADNTDVYAFVSPDAPDTATLIANFIPLEQPAGGPNFYTFGDDVLYAIHISNIGAANPDISYQFQFTRQIQNPNTFLYNTGPISSLDDPNWNVRQTYTLTKVVNGNATVIGTNLATPPCRIGPRSTPKYDQLAGAAVLVLPSGETVFAGQRADPFFVDLGSIFDLGDLRPFQNLHLIPTPAANGVNGLKGFTVHTIAVQVPIKNITSNGTRPTSIADPAATIGVCVTASRQTTRVLAAGSPPDEMGPWIQVSRLGNPLVNEVIIPLGMKDPWNQTPVDHDSQFVQAFNQPGLAALLPVLYPGAFPNLAALKADRADLVAILLTGIPAGIIPNFQNVTGGTVQADMLRLNTAIPPSTSPNPAGVVGGDFAGFPNGRRLMDDVTTIELCAIAGVTYPLIDKTFTPDAAASQVTDAAGPDPDAPLLGAFPHAAYPYEGYSGLDQGAPST